jgi:hypothetical protein
MQLFGTDRVLLYDVPPWNALGFGVAAFGDKVGTLSLPIHGLADEIGRLQLYIMTHVDAMRSQPPGPNTIRRLGRMINRVRSILGGRQKTYDQLRTEGGHAQPTPKIWTIHPVPYFDGPILQNHWLMEYNDLCMVALTNIYQHSDNNLPLTITEKFASEIWQYFNDIKLLLGSELLRIPRAELDKPDFQFTEAHYAAYRPDEVTINIESLDSPGPIFSLPTEDDLRPLLRGIPANMIAPNLRQYPIGPLPGITGISGEELPKGEEAVGTISREAIGPPTV